LGVKIVENKTILPLKKFRNAIGIYFYLNIK
jgi:hypothetical protein